MLGVRGGSSPGVASGSALSPGTQRARPVGGTLATLTPLYSSAAPSPSRLRISSNKSFHTPGAI